MKQWLVFPNVAGAHLTLHANRDFNTEADEAASAGRNAVDLPHVPHPGEFVRQARLFFDGSCRELRRGCGWVLQSRARVEDALLMPAVGSLVLPLSYTALDAEALAAVRWISCSIAPPSAGSIQPPLAAPVSPCRKPFPFGRHRSCFDFWGAVRPRCSRIPS